MNDEQWRLFLQTARRILGKGQWDPALSESWCAFTTFSSLERGMRYWSCGLPEEVECEEHRTVDGGLWRQSFFYSDLAHVVIPKTFYWERIENSAFSCGENIQSIEELASRLDRSSIPYRLTNLVLEVKLY